MATAPLEEVEAGLRARSLDKFYIALQAALRLGDVADEVVAEAAATRTGTPKLLATAALGDLHGIGGSGVLRVLVANRGPGTQDLRCAAILALAKRDQADATDVLVESVGDSDPEIRFYALLCLAAVGDDRGWGNVFRQCDQTLARSRRKEKSSEYPFLALAVTYLLCSSPPDRSRLFSVASLIRRHSGNLLPSESRWLRECMPEVLTDRDFESLNFPDCRAMRERYRNDSLFADSAIP